MVGSCQVIRIFNRRLYLKHRSKGYQLERYLPLRGSLEGMSCVDECMNGGNDYYNPTAIHIRTSHSQHSQHHYIVYLFWNLSKVVDEGNGGIPLPVLP